MPARQARNPALQNSSPPCFISHGTAFQPNSQSLPDTNRENRMHDIIRQLAEKREAARLGGGQKRINAQHAKGKLTA